MPVLAWEFLGGNFHLLGVREKVQIIFWILEYCKRNHRVKVDDWISSLTLRLVFTFSPTLIICIFSCSMLCRYFSVDNKIQSGKNANKFIWKRAIALGLFCSASCWNDIMLITIFISIQKNFENRVNIYCPLNGVHHNFLGSKIWSTQKFPLKSRLSH